MAETPMICLKNVIKIYKTPKMRFRALGGIDLEIEKGEFAAVCGTSGSGKSTLLQLCAGLDRPTSGQILVRGAKLHRMSEDQLAVFRLRHVGFIFQNFNLFPELTTLENAAFPLMLLGMSRTKREKRAARLLEQLDLGEHLDHAPDELSGGQQQRVSIARALVTRPEILFADEPTGNLDAATADATMRLLQRQVEERGTTLLMVTHDMEKAHRANRIISIADGEIVSIDSGDKQ